LNWIRNTLAKICSSLSRIFPRMGRRKNKVPRVPIHGKAAHNAAFQTAIGGLVINWANNESVFLAMLQVLLVGGPKAAAIVWHSHRTSVAKLELVHRLCRERVKNTELMSEITAAINQFKGFSRTRNFFCHAMYEYDKDLNLGYASGLTSPQEGEPLVSEDKPMDLATLNEISFASVELGKFNQRLWVLVQRLEIELGVQRIKLPKRQQERQQNQDAPDRPDTDEKPEEPR
jgi:hypothetical protein